MKQLSPHASQMLFRESIDTPDQINPLNIYDQATAPGGKVTFKGILETVRKGLDDAPLFRQKLVRVPYDLDEPYWVDDPDFDLEFHVRHIALPRPGDWRQLCILVSRLISRRLDHSRPMWEMYVIERLDNIEGLPTDSFAILYKIHHTMVADNGNISLLSAIHDFEPTPPKPPRTKLVIPWSPEPMPAPVNFVASSLKKLAFKPGHFLGVARRVGPKLYSFRELKKTRTPFRVPRSPFNGKVTSNRVFDSVFFKLNELKPIRQLAKGATINDVAISIIGGAMRSYMISRKHLPRESLVASVPVSMHTGKKGSAGKVPDDVVIQEIPIFTNVEDPVERLQLIGNVMRETKHYINAVGAKNLAELSSAVPGLVSGLAAQAMARLSLMAGETMSCNTVITNVPGGQQPLYMTGAKMHLSTTCGPLTRTIGLVNSVTSYCGTLSISFTGCRDLIPDPNVYRDCLEASYNKHLELLSSSAHQHVEA